MNLATKIVVKADERKSIQLTKRFYIKPTFDSVYLKKTNCNNDKIMQINS